MNLWNFAWLYLLVVGLLAGLGIGVYWAVRQQKRIGHILLAILAIPVLWWGISTIYFVTPLAEKHCISEVKEFKKGDISVNRIVENISKNTPITWRSASYNNRCIVQARINGRNLEWIKIYWDNQIYANNEETEALGFPVKAGTQVDVQWEPDIPTTGRKLK